MKINFIFIFYFSFILCLDSKDIFFDLTKNNKWNLIDNHNDKNIYECKSTLSNYKYFKIEKEIDLNPSLVLETIKNISQYDLIISNKNIRTKLIKAEDDTLYAYQIIKNSIPFVKDRQYIFKIFEVSDNKLGWYILSVENDLHQFFFQGGSKTLSLGAGFWSIEYIKEQRVLTNALFVDDEVNMPDILLEKIRINNVIDIFDDVLIYVKENL